MGLSDPARDTTLAQLSAARGEYESFQIVIHAPVHTGLSHVNVAVTDLTMSGGHVIPKSNIALFREIRDKYVNKAAPPASTTIGVPELARPGALFEIEAVAVLPVK